MTRYAALLRGLGPATHPKMPLGELAEACGAAGLHDVTTVGNTGNLVFDSDRSQAEVEGIVTAAVKRFGLGNEVFTRTQRQLLMLVNLAPFPEAAAERPGRLATCFFHKDPHWPVAYRSYAGPEKFRMFSNHLVVDYGTRLAPSKLTIEASVGARMTQRNWSSVLAIFERLNT